MADIERDFDVVETALDSFYVTEILFGVGTIWTLFKRGKKAVAVGAGDGGAGSESLEIP